MQRGVEVSWKPGEEQVEVVVVSGHAECKPPDLLPSQQEPERRFMARIDSGFILRAASRNVITLGRRQLRIVSRIAINSPEQSEIDEAEDTGRCETCAPTPVV